MQETNLIEQEQPVGVLTAPVPAPAPTMTLCSYGSKANPGRTGPRGNARGDSNPQTHSPYRGGGKADRSTRLPPDRHRAGGIRRISGRDAHVRSDGPELRLRGLPFRHRLAEFAMISHSGFPAPLGYASSFVKILRFTGNTLPFSRSIRSTSHSKTAWPSVSIGCRGTSGR